MPKQRQTFLGVTLLDEEVESPIALKPCQERLLHNWQQCGVELTLPGISQELFAATTVYSWEAKAMRNLRMQREKQSV